MPLPPNYRAAKNGWQFVIRLIAYFIAAAALCHIMGCVEAHAGEFDGMFAAPPGLTDHRHTQATNETPDVQHAPPVPEPSPVALLAVGVGVLVVIGWTVKGKAEK